MVVHLCVKLTGQSDAQTLCSKIFFLGVSVRVVSGRD